MSQEYDLPVQNGRNNILAQMAASAQFEDSELWIQEENTGATLSNDIFTLRIPFTQQVGVGSASQTCLPQGAPC